MLRKKFSLTLPLLILSVSMTLCVRANAQTLSTRLWYDQPARRWTQALPLGNGRLGAMVYGGAGEETIVLNEQTLYAGEPVPCGVPAIYNHVDAVYDLLRRGRYVEADQLIQAKMTGRLHQSYTVMGRLRLNNEHEDKVSDYERSLDLSSAEAAVRYRAGGRMYERRMFISAVDDVMVMRLTCDKPGSITCTLTLDTPHHFARTSACDNRTIALRAKAPLYATKRGIGTIRQLKDQAKYPELFDASGSLRNDLVKASDQVFYATEPGGPGMGFEIRVRAVAEGGSVAASGDGLRIKGADAVTLLVTGATSFNGPDRSPSRDGADPAQRCDPRLAPSADKPFDALRRAHQEDYRALFERVAMVLGTENTTDAPTDQRITDYQRTRDPQLAALLFNYGRYLLISSSRPGGWPANLQGLWSNDVVTPWCGAFHLDINLQMNYWPAQVANLRECGLPLIDYIERLAARGAVTARQSYRCRGWCAPIATSIWCNTDPLDLSAMTAWNMGGVWLCRLVWDHYAFSGDRVFLSDRAYPLMKGAAEFCLDQMRVDEQGRLVTPISFSPENRFHTADGQIAAASIASTMDMAMIRELLLNTLHAAALLNRDARFQGQMRQALERMTPYRVGRLGQFQEWSQDWDRPNDQHRHLSHLWPVYPGSQIDPIRTPDLAAAAARSLQMRGPGDLEFSLAWRMGLWSRLKRPDLAAEAMNRLMQYHLNDNLTTRCYPDKQEPFEIDGNLGFVAGVAELLVHSRLDFIEGRQVSELHLLPALPPIWPRGAVRGLRARGGGEIGMTWEGGRLVEATLHADTATVRRLRCDRPMAITAAGRRLATRKVDEHVIEWDTEPGIDYVITPMK